MEAPKLIEPGVKHHLYQTLHNCHDTRVSLYTWILNIGVFVIFMGITISALYFCYTRKLSPEEEKQRQQIKPIKPINQSLIF